jgi:hypothetical protein
VERGGSRVTCFAEKNLIQVQSKIIIFSSSRKLIARRCKRGEIVFSLEFAFEVLRVLPQDQIQGVSDE